jgi:hypothetical protein
MTRPTIPSSAGLRRSVLAALLLGAASAAAPAAEHAHAPASAETPEHAHAQSAAAAVTGLKLDGSRKWQTDAPLRAGMANVRRAFDADHAAIHAGRETDAQYDALAGTIQREVDGIVRACRLPPAADANLHLVIADLLAGVQMLRGQVDGASRHDGAARVHGALLAYGKFFDDPAAGRM